MIDYTDPVVLCPVRTMNLMSSGYGEKSIDSLIGHTYALISERSNFLTRLLS